MREPFDHYINQVTKKTIDWSDEIGDRKIVDNLFKITQESRDFPVADEGGFDGPKTFISLKGGKPGCQFRLVNKITLDDGEELEVDYWVNCVKDPAQVAAERKAQRPNPKSTVERTAPNAV